MSRSFRRVKWNLICLITSIATIAIVVALYTVTQTTAQPPLYASTATVVEDSKTDIEHPGGDWSMWGGTPSRNMVSAEKNIPDFFEPGEYLKGTETIDISTTENVKWVAKSGSQTYGNPTISDGRVYVGTNNDGRNDPRFPGDFSILRCLKEKTGEVLWTLTVPKLDSGKVNDWEFLGIASSPVVEDNRVYLVTNRCEVVCLDALGMSDGNQGYQDEGKYMADLKYVALGKAEPIEVTDADADILWRYDLRDELGVFPHNITSSSPLIVGDNVWTLTSNGVNYDHVDTPNPNAPIVICLDKMTGELTGEEISGLSTRVLHCAWSSPAYGVFGGQETVVIGGPDGVLYGFDAKPIPDPEDPEYNILTELWRFDANPVQYRYKGGDRSAPIKYVRPNGPSEFISTPVIYKGKIYAAIGQDPEHGEGIGNMVCIDPTKTHEEQWIVDLETHTFAEAVWQLDEIDRGVSTAAVFEDLVYVGDFTGRVFCIDANTGEVYWKYDTFERVWGSPLVVDGKVFIGNEAGDVLVFKHGKEEELINSMNVTDPVYSTPVAANGVLYIGSQTQLYAIEAND